MSIRKNTLWNLIGSGAPMLIGLAAVPYLLKSIGVERLGVLTLVWALIGYFTIFDFGLGRALTQQVAALRAKGDAASVAGTVRAGLKLLTWIGFGGTSLAMIGFLTWDSGWFSVSPALQADVKHCLVLVALSIPATTLTSGLKGVLEGVEHFRDVNVLRSLLGVANFVFPVLAVMWHGPNLTLIVASLVFARLIMLALHAILVRRVLRGPEAGVARAGAASLRGLIAFGSWMTLSNIVSPLMVIADRFVVASIVGAAMVAYYTVPADALLRLLIVPAALSTSIFPAFSRHMVSSLETTQHLYRRSLLAVFVVMGPLMLAIALGSHTGLALWLGEGFADRAWLCVVLLSGGILFNSLAQIPYALVQGAGRVKPTALLHLSEFVVYAPLLYWGAWLYGIEGAAAVWTLRAAVDALVLHALAQRILRPDATEERAGVIDG